jgi:hypothetical protein
LDVGGPYLSQDPGLASRPSQTYHDAYGSSYRFGGCVFSKVAGFSRQNDAIRSENWIVNETQFEFPADTRIIRLEMMPFFSAKYDPSCTKYGYDCGYFQNWTNVGGTVVFMDSHAKQVSGAGAFDNQVVNPQGNKSGESTQSGTPYDDTWYWRCD